MASGIKRGDVSGKVCGKWKCQGEISMIRKGRCIRDTKVNNNKCEWEIN